jgi:MFS family permease
MKDVYEWNSSRQGIILSSFFFGYIFSQVPGGWIAGRFGAKRVFGFGVLVTTLLTLVTPVVAPYYSLLIVVRIIEGFFEGVTFPAMMAMWGRWAPPLERSRLAAFGMTGAFAGTIAAIPISYALIGSNILGGWPSVFYIFGAIGCVWWLLWTWLAYDSPEVHSYISEEEKFYITTTIKSQQTGTNFAKVPWRELLTSLPVWSLVAMNTGANWGFYTLLTGLSTYLHVGLDVPTSRGGLDATLPYISVFITAISAGRLADYLRDNRGISTGVVRKLFNTSAYIIVASFLVVSTDSACTAGKCWVILYNQLLFRT